MINLIGCRTFHCVLVYVAVYFACASIATAQDNQNSGQRMDIEIVFAEPEFTFTLQEAADGIVIDYRIVIHRDVPGVFAIPQDDGQATLPGPSGLIPFEDLRGGEQRYCIKDIGAGAGPQGTPKTLKRNSYPRRFEWDGRNWLGPSDTSNPKGKPFPVGAYTLRVSCKGQQFSGDSKSDFLIEKAVRVTLVE